MESKTIITNPNNIKGKIYSPFENPGCMVETMLPFQRISRKAGGFESGSDYDVIAEWRGLIRRILIDYGRILLDRILYMSPGVRN